VASTGRLIQYLVLASTLLGVLFLWVAYPVLPPLAFDFVAFGWVLFAVDSVLTFLRPTISYYLAFLLALVALVETLSQPAHYVLIEQGDLLATAIIVLGSVVQALILLAVPYHFVLERRKGEWAWPGAKSQA
jgi:hypothetical protein